ncbi:hypothetical protein [Nocardia iowensis]|uniref:Uncharacterized protein n=1 Tax=Nocardia iowensis TaxID=204891 RepID=A0ABX8RZV1_NOCIO|nr:hypothetical protein [Nocardia iowensis]QXN95083.1 hypothetical protein KV110_19785 [Nocardia iowensis]
MRLVVNRSQTAVKGMLGGHKGMQFTLSCRLQLTDEENRLVQQYKLTEYPLTWRTFQGTKLVGDTIGSLVQGSSQTVSDVKTLLTNEDVIKDAIDELPTLFAVCRTFGGNEIIDYPRAKSA